jgi:hypothetical protein
VWLGDEEQDRNRLDLARGVPGLFNRACTRFGDWVGLGWKGVWTMEDSRTVLYYTSGMESPEGENTSVRDHGGSDLSRSGWDWPPICHYLRYLT